MEDFQLQIEKITGQADSKASTAVFSARVSFGDSSIGTLVSCILVKGDKGGEVKNIFDAAMRKLEVAESGSLDLLKRATEASTDYVNAGSIEASFVHCLFYKNASFIGKSGDRVKVWVYEPPKSIELAFSHGSGPLRSGQLYLIPTEKFLSSFDLSEYLNQDEVNVEEIVDGLATEISAKNERSEIAAALVHVKGGTETVKDTKDSDEEIRRGQDQFNVEGEKKPLDTAHEIAAPPTSNVPPPPDVVGASGPKVVDSEHATSANEDSAVSQDSSKSREAVVPQGQGGVLSRGSGVVKLLSKIPGAIFSEIANLRRGNIKAIFRLRRNIVMVAVAVLLILAGSAFFTLRGNENRQTANEFNKILESATAKYEEGLALLDLNRERARGIFIEADNEVKKALEIMPKDEKALDLAGKISAKLADISSQTAVGFETVYESGSPFVSLSLANGDLVGVVSGKVYVVDVESGGASEVDGVEGAKSGIVYDNKAFIFDGSSVYRIDLAAGEGEKIVEGETSKDLSVFLGNIYLLGSDQIFKYVPVEDGYAQSINYLNEKEQFSTNSSFVIDGSIWVTNGGEVFKYLRGEKQDFAISGVTTSSKLGEIYTDSEAENLYVVDIENSTLLVIDKDGVYKKSYQASEFAIASDLVVDEEAGKFYISVGSKVLEGNL